MASGGLSRFGYMIQQGSMARVEQMVAQYPTMVSTSISMTGCKGKVEGTILHVSKSKKVIYNAKFGEKKMKKETSYFRMVFCR